MTSNRPVTAAAGGMPIANLFRDPALRRAFSRFDQDGGSALVAARHPKPSLDGGAEAQIRAAFSAHA